MDEENRVIIDKNQGMRELYSLEQTKKGYAEASTSDVKSAEDLITGWRPDSVPLDPYDRHEYVGIPSRTAALWF